MTRVLADDHHVAVTADDLALVTDLLDAGVDLHGDSLCSLSSCPRDAEGRYLQQPLLVAVNDPAAGQIVWAQLNDHAVLWENSDVVLTHLARDVGKNFVAVGQLNAKHCVGKSFDYCALDFDDTVFFGHSLTVAQYIGSWSCVDCGENCTPRTAMQDAKDPAYVIELG